MHFLGFSSRKCGGIDNWWISNELAACFRHLQTKHIWSQSLNHTRSTYQTMPYHTYVSGFTMVFTQYRWIFPSFTHPSTKLPALVTSPGRCGSRLCLGNTLRSTFWGSPAIPCREEGGGESHLRRPQGGVGDGGDPMVKTNQKPLEIGVMEVIFWESTWDSDWFWKTKFWKDNTIWLYIWQTWLTWGKKGAWFGNGGVPDICDISMDQMRL